MMAVLQSADRRQLMIRVSFALMWVMVVFHIVRHVQAQNGFYFGDWVIDYRQGFVRRGLAGSVLTYLGGLVGWGGWQLVPVVVAGLWGIFLLRFAQVLARRDMPFWYVLLLLSPVGIAFTNYLLGDIARKDTMHFALLAQFLWLLDKDKLNTAWMVALTALAFAAGLSHEFMVFYAAYFLIAAYWSGQGRPAWLAALAISAAATAAALCVALWARPFDGPAFCTDLMERQGGSASLCRGIIVWKLLTLSESFQDTMNTAAVLGYPSVYIPAVLLAFAPMVMWMKRYTAGDFKSVLWPIAVAVVLSAPLFLLAVDWGRFVQIHAVSSAMVLIFKLPRRKAGDVGAAAPAANAAPSARPGGAVRHLFNVRHRALRALLVVICLGWTVTWQMPLCCGDSPYRGIVAKVAVRLGLLEPPPPLFDPKPQE